MIFPDARRVIYKKSSLINVMCQLRFPPILKIDTDIPEEFQEAIKNEFPIYNEQALVQPLLIPAVSSARPASPPGLMALTSLAQPVTSKAFPPVVLPSMPMDLMNQLTTPIISGMKNHTFISEDNNWRINLTRTFISINTTHYQKWEDFIGQFQRPFEIFIKKYQPAFFTRIGLRYINVFCRSKLGLKDTNWNELVNENILGMLSSDFSSNIKTFNNMCEINLENESILRVLTSIATPIDKQYQNEPCLLIDSDYFSQERSSEDQVFDKLEYLHTEATNMIKWVLKDELHTAMEPLYI